MNIHKKSLIAFVASLGLTMFFSCSNSNKLKLDFDSSGKTFHFVDVKSGKQLSYNKIIIDDKEVIDMECSGVGMSKGVIFAFEKGQIIRDGNSTTYNGCSGFTEHAELEYRLEDGVLIIFSNNPTQKEPDKIVSNASNESEVKTLEKPKQELQFKGGTCILSSVTVSSFTNSNTLMLVFDCKLKEGSNTSVLQILQDNGKIVTSSGESFVPSQDPFVNANSIALVFKVPDSFPAKSLKFVFEKQELLLNQYIY